MPPKVTAGSLAKTSGVDKSIPMELNNTCPPLQTRAILQLNMNA